MINAAGLDLIKKFEGFQSEAYKDPIGVWTIGYGETRDVKEGDAITKIEAEAMLLKRCSEIERRILRLLNVQLTSTEMAALISFAYNVGIGNLEKSTLLRLINQNNFTQAAEQFGKWINAGGNPLPGLIKRREAEKQLFLT